MPAFDLSLLQQWVGKTETLHDTVHPGTIAALAATLDLPAPAAALPPLWHWILFWSAAPGAQLGEDGHPRRGGFLPPVPLPRRMWAGGRLTFIHPVPIGADLTRKSTIRDVQAKDGATGPLAFVTVRHEIAHDGVTAITEEHDIVYRGLPAPGTPAPAAKAPPGGAEWSRTIVPDPVLLFRYSALTFNGHRIHYDRSYVTDVEGYPGLIVHGPLIATLLLELLRARLPDAKVASFSFRAVAPLFDTAPFTVRGKRGPDGTVLLWAETPDGALAMQAEAQLTE
ncbi:3-methylfumaryl-CoA hydratase [Pseudoduganella flava]|uniref:3-methylfumaryl-CoA hydratase n=1 Tax=Pseudoduganella flava TaxID=871742 RepID=A0A562PDG3_9BURK|nr:MaoC family dehydratase N-terminal domain-containing protein [Pseudoduganella flava]QGZ42172.1 acyl-CoA dehydrogenase [Pseudoduganella flava]TWI42449.1 3-methylfumaryl-CoA hydratase [Pseudoduganella flava]